jgi:ureidoglycolate lyase
MSAVRSVVIRAEPLTPDGFAPFGDVMAPRASAPITNRTLIDKGFVRIADKVSDARYPDFDVLDYWTPIAEISRDTMRFGYLRPRRRALRLSWFERHVLGTQSFIPLGGKRSLFVVAPRGDNADPAALPDLGAVRGFLLDGDAGVTIHPGTWHWTPFPLEDGADFIILVRDRAGPDDLNFVDLEARLGARVEVKT